MVAPANTTMATENQVPSWKLNSTEPTMSASAANPIHMMAPRMKEKSLRVMNTTAVRPANPIKVTAAAELMTPGAEALAIHSIGTKMKCFGHHIGPECRVLDSPGRCLESEARGDGGDDHERPEDEQPARAGHEFGDRGGEPAGEEQDLEGHEGEDGAQKVQVGLGDEFGSDRGSRLSDGSGATHFPGKFRWVIAHVKDLRFQVDGMVLGVARNELWRKMSCGAK